MLTVAAAPGFRFRQVEMAATRQHRCRKPGLTPMNDKHKIMKDTLPPRHHPARAIVASTLVIALLGLAACNRKSDDTPPAAAASAASAPAASDAQPAPAAYTPPSADQLYQMVAPIALFPDKLVALVLAGATYPDQVTAANTWLGQNPTLKGADLTAAADAQPWDPSVKALTAFPAVLSQMASNIEWTTALGQAYYHDPNDVLNAIQVMRQRAQKAGHLSSGSQLHVTQVAQAAPPPSYTPAQSGPAIYEGPPIVPPPPQTIVIEPAQPDTVYVPAYNPAVVYGEPEVYPGYAYRPSYDTGAVVTAGVLSFGVGIAVGALFSHHDWGWHSWGVNWGAPHPGGPAWGNRERPAVVYNHTTYISKSTTVINNIHNTRITNNVTNNYGNTTNNVGNLVNRGAPPAGVAAAQQMREQQAAREQQMREHPGAPHPAPSAMSMPHFGANDTRPGERPEPHPDANRPNEMAAHAGPGEPHPGEARRVERNEATQGGAHPPAEGRAPENVPHPPANANAMHGPNPANGEMREMPGMPMHQQAEPRREPEAPRNEPAEAPRQQHEAPPQAREAFQPQHEVHAPPQQHEAPRPAAQPRPAEHAQHEPEQHAAPHPQEHERQQHR